VAFVATNLDDVFLLTAFFADPRFRARSIVLGQLLGIGALVVGSWVAALASLAVPAGYPALLGVVPLALGLFELRNLRGAGAGSDDDEDAVREAAARAARRTHSQMLAVAAVTVANGADNVAVYVPLFARDPRAVPIIAGVFALMTVLLCLAGYQLVRHETLGAPLRRFGPVALPFVLVALGVWILSGARVLLD
jgi:cadmium resistance protein CadD (predicted permease)